MPTTRAQTTPKRSASPAKKRPTKAPVKKKESALEYYFSLEHGSETDKVPLKWRSSPKLQPLTLYGLSSFNYSLAGLLLAVLLSVRPERSIYPFERVEAALWIWQGLISFKCDALDIGIRSWSHPVDRISAVVFTVQQTVKYCFVRCGGTWGLPLYIFLFGVLGVGVSFFNKSCVACRNQDLEGFRMYHVLWHYIFPVTMAVFYCAQFLAPLSHVECRMAEWGG